MRAATVDVTVATRGLANPLHQCLTFHRDESRLQGQVSLFGGKGLPGVEVVVLDEWWSRRRKSSCTLNINSVNLEPVKMAVDVVLKFHKRSSGDVNSEPMQPSRSPDSSDASELQSATHRSSPSLMPTGDDSVDEVSQPSGQSAKFCHLLAQVVTMPLPLCSEVL